MRVLTHPKAVRPDGARREALRRRASATDALAKAQRCTRQLQAFALPKAQPLRYPPPQPLHRRKCNLCAFASATFALPATATFAFPRVHICAHAAPYGHAGRGLGASADAKRWNPLPQTHFSLCFQGCDAFPHSKMGKLQLLRCRSALRRLSFPSRNPFRQGCKAFPPPI